MTAIMVVDDDANVLTGRKMTLESKGSHVRVLTDPVLALKHQGIKENGGAECKIVPSDIIMPKVAGVELSKYIKEARPDWKSLIVSSMPVHKEDWRNLILLRNRRMTLLPKYPH